MDCKIRRYFRHGTLTQLRVFDTVVRLGSFTRAGETLHMAQPTVSVHMKKLAETIGTSLFEQRGKQMRLTAAGEKLHAACQQIFDTIYDLDAALNGSNTTDARKLVGASGELNVQQRRRASCFKGACRKS